MARSFDGVNDNLLSANNALPSLNVSQRSIAAWVQFNATGSVLFQTMTQDGAGTGRTSFSAVAPAVSGYKGTFVSVGSTSGQWTTPDVPLSERHHLAFVYDRGSVANDPTIYVDGASVTVTETATPVAISTADDTLKIGESSSGGSDLTGLVAHLAIDVNALWDAADVNRARWWGRPHGGLYVYHPLLSTKLADEGSSGVTLGVSGTTVAAFDTPCVRPGSALMGMGVGW